MRRGTFLVRDIPISGPGNIRILIADRQEATRSALRMLLHEEDGLRVVSEAADSEDLVRQLATVLPDVIVLDWDLPGAPVEKLLTRIRDLDHHIHVVVLSARPEDATKVLEAGADAFFSKAHPPRQLVRVISGQTSP
jgi:DNA-binding NarL/FixJ family response regulator